MDRDARREQLRGQRALGRAPASWRDEAGATTSDYVVLLVGFATAAALAVKLVVGIT